MINAQEMSFLTVGLDMVNRKATTQENLKNFHRSSGDYSLSMIHGVFPLVTRYSREEENVAPFSLSSLL